MYHWDALSGNVSLSCSLPVFILDKYYIISFSWKKSPKQNITVSWPFLKHCRLLRNSSSIYFNFWKKSWQEEEEQGQVLLPSSCFIPSPVHSMHAQCSTSRHLHLHLKGLSVNSYLFGKFWTLGNQFWWAVFIQTYLFSWDHLHSNIDLTNKDDGFPCGNASSERDKVDELGGALLCCSCDNTPYL